MFHYRHRQVGLVHRVLLVALVATTALYLGSAELRTPVGLAFLGGVGALLGVVALAFRHLDTEVTDDELRLAFGPLPLASRTVPLRSIRGARRGRSGWIDGWGIHWRPGAGWIWNVGGFALVELELEHGRLRVGTDDPDGLVAALERATA